MKFGNLFAHFNTNPDWLRFLRQRLRLLLAWLVIVLVVSLVGWISLAANLDKDRKHVEEEASKNALSLSKVYANYLTQTIAAIDQLMLHVRYEWELSDGLLPLESIRDRRGPHDTRHTDRHIDLPVRRSGSDIDSRFPRTRRQHATRRRRLV